MVHTVVGSLTDQIRFFVDFSVGEINISEHGAYGCWIIRAFAVSGSFISANLCLVAGYVQIFFPRLVAGYVQLTNVSSAISVQATMLVPNPAWVPGRYDFHIEVRSKQKTISILNFAATLRIFRLSHLDLALG